MCHANRERAPAGTTARRGHGPGFARQKASKSAAYLAGMITILRVNERLMLHSFISIQFKLNARFLINRKDLVVLLGLLVAEA